ncbi:MAG: hypothetical protein ACRCZP_18815 [Phycicoccus sp.]
MSPALPTAAASRIVLACGAALLSAAVVVTPAGAESAELDYDCDWAVGAQQGNDAVVVSFDTAVEDGLTVDVGDEVDLDPHTGRLTLPIDFVLAASINGPISISGGVLHSAFVDETGEDLEVDLEFPSTPMQTSDPTVLDLTGTSDPVVADEAGTYTVVADSFVLTYGDEDDGGSMFCELVDDGDAAIDAFEAVAAATPPPGTPTTTTTTTASASASPERPEVVQTDVAGGRPRALPYAVLGGAVVIGAVAAAGTRRRAGSRRH